MDLKSGYPFWAIKNGLMHAFPRLEAHRACDVAVIGGGISGALVADELSRHGHEVVVVEQRDIAWGSTAASTALLQYEIDTHLVELAKRYGEADAVAAYVACAEAIPALAALAAAVRDVDFARAESLYLASKRRHVPILAAEQALRARHGLPAAWLDRAAVRARYDLDAPAAILSSLGATVDPYRLTSRLLVRAARRGVAVFDRTTIARVEPGARGVTLRTGDGVTIRARHVVVASGYEGQRWLSQRVAHNHSSYACITDPIAPASLGVLAHTMVWESARPYLYLRTTPDHRLLVGGEDDDVDVPARRDARVDRRAARLLRRVATMFPRLTLQPAFAWAGTFAETADGLPFFGAHAEHGPRVLFAMAYGGNGITYAMIGAGILRAAIERRRHPLARLWSFARLG